MATTLGCEPFIYSANDATGVYAACAQIIPNGTMVFVPEVYSGAEWSIEEELMSFQGVAAAFSLLDQTCIPEVAKMVCTSRLKRCIEVDGVWLPQLPCQSVCNQMKDVCSSELERLGSELLAQFGGLAAPDCEAHTIGSEDACVQINSHPTKPLCVEFLWNGYESFMPQYDGILAYPEVASTLNDGTSVQCFSPDAIFELDCSNMQCIEGTVFGEKVGSECPDCVFPCPSPHYTESEYTTQWVMYVLPSLISIPMNILLLYALYKPGNKKFRKSKPPHITVCAVLSLAFSLLDTVVVTAKYSDLPCSNAAGEACDNCMAGASALCLINRTTIHILQALFFTLTFLMIEIYLTLVKERTQSKAQGFRKQAIVVSTFVPILCACLTIGLDDDSEDSPNALMNSIRAGFNCNPRFTTLGTEWVVVHSWFALASIAIGFMVSSIAMKIRAVARSASSSLEVPKSLILLGSMASMLFVFNLFVVLYSVPLLDQYADDSEEWLDVAQTYMVGIGQPDAVGDSPAQEWEEPYPLSTIDSIPTSSVITLGYFCTGVMPLLTPVVFLTSKQYMEAIGIKFGKGSKKSGKVAAASTKMSTSGKSGRESSGMSSAAASLAASSAAQSSCAE